MSDLHLRWCYACPVVHAENCPECFGFGFKIDGNIIAASEVDRFANQYACCNTCGGTPKGSDKAPVQAREEKMRQIAIAAFLGVCVGVQSYALYTVAKLFFGR